MPGRQRSQKTSASANVPRALLTRHSDAIAFVLGNDGNIPMGQHLIHVLLMAAHDGGDSPGIHDLVEMTGLPRSSVSRHVGELIRLGILQDTIDPEDRRRRTLRMSPKGLRQRERFLTALGKGRKLAH